MPNPPAIITAAFEVAPIGMQILRQLDPTDKGSFQLVAANAAACDVLKQDMKADIGRTWNETSPDLAQSDFADLFADALHNQKSVSWEVEYGDARFERNWWRGTGTPVDERTLVIVFQNITAEKERHLELQRSNRALDDFAFIASHDLRAPLRDIDNLATWIANDLDDLPEPSARHLATLRQRVSRLDRLLMDLLAYSRAGRVFAKPERFLLSDVFASMRALVPHVEGFDVIFPETDLQLDAPRPPLETILRNLIANAIKHHHRDHGRVEIAVDPTESEVVFHVRDDGPGIPPSLHDRAFGMFQTLQPRDRVEGTGMGLALVKKLIEGYDQRIWLDSDEGRGSTFSFTWPIAWSNRNGRGT